MIYTLELENYWNKITINEKEFLPVGAAAAAVNKNENSAYIFGGTDYHTHSNKLYKFDMNNERFELIDELNIMSRFNHKMFLSNDNKLIIIGGVTTIDEGTHVHYCDDILMYDLATKELSAITIPTGTMQRGQFTAAIHYSENSIYVFGGFNKSDLFTINSNTKQIESIHPEGATLNARAGMISEVLADGRLFIFSGFAMVNNKPVCYNDYYLYNSENNTITQKECNENIGRTFSKSFIYEAQKKVILFGGSPNGMESSGSLYFYDYEKDFFNIAYIQPLPKQRVEPTVIFSEKNKKMYVIAGLEPNGRMGYTALHEIMVLDFTKVGNDAWLGHP